jgi:hypothetical protein
MNRSNALVEQVYERKTMCSWPKKDRLLLILSFLLYQNERISVFILFSTLLWHPTKDQQHQIPEIHAHEPTTCVNVML